MAKRSGVQDFLTNFNVAYGMARKVGQDMELADIAKAKPEEMQGFTTDDTAQLEAAAKSGQYDIGTKTRDDGTFEAYTVTPKADPTQTGTIAMQGVTDLMGSRTAGSMTPAQLNSARERAMAGVLMKSDPVQGMRMMRDVTQGERDDLRFGREQRDWAINDKKHADEEEYKAGYQAEFGNSILAQQMKEYAPKVQEYVQQKAAYDARVKAGEPPHVIGMPPVKPQAPAYSMAQALADNGRLLAFRASKGKADPAEMLKYAETFKKVADEGYGQALKLAQGGAPLEQVAKVFNQSGTVRFDPASVVSDGMVAGPGGAPSRVIKFKDQNGAVQSINVLAELDSIGQADGYFNRFFKAEDNRRDDAKLVLLKNADGRSAAAASRAAASDAQTKAEKLAKAEADVALFKERNPKATPVEIEAVRRGRLDPVPKSGAYKVEMGDVTSAFGTPAFGDDGKPLADLMTGRQVINRNPKEEAVFFKWMADNGITDTNKGLAIYLGQKQSGAATGGQSSSAGAAGPAPKISTKADFDRLPAGARFTAPDGTVRVKQ